MIWFFLTSGLFLGWSLGANDAANIFGTAVATRMVKFRTAAIIASLFVIIGAVISGAGAAKTLGHLGAINALGGSFTVALAAALTVAWMTKLGLPVSTTQAIVGAIIGWDLFTGYLIDTTALSKIVSTWVISPILSGIFAYFLFKLFRLLLKILKIHLLEVDLYTRFGLILIGAFGAYSLGANNIANVMGVFVPAHPFNDVNLFGIIRLTGTQQLFLLGGLAIACGIYTYSLRVMKTVGRDIFKLSPINALVVVLAESLVLFIFASESLERFLITHGLPAIPLVPVSSSQAVVGAVIGIGLARGGGRAINFGVLKKIAWGWVLTPLSAGIMSFFALFFMQNVFQQKVYEPVPYVISSKVLNRLEKENIEVEKLVTVEGRKFSNARRLKYYLRSRFGFSNKEIGIILKFSEVDTLIIDSFIAKKELDPDWFTPEQLKTLNSLHGTIFEHKWELSDTLQKLSPQWKFKPRSAKNILFNRDLKHKYDKLFFTFKKRNISPHNQRLSRK